MSFEYKSQIFSRFLGFENNGNVYFKVFSTFRAISKATAYKITAKVVSKKSSPCFKVKNRFEHAVMATCRLLYANVVATIPLTGTVPSCRNVICIDYMVSAVIINDCLDTKHEQ